MSATTPLLAAACAALASAALAVTAPPERINYQGVLRDALGTPLDGRFDMVFRLVESGSGNEILVDQHAGALGVVVTGGLFDVQIGGGMVSDGAGPGTYTSLSQVFRDFADVVLRVQVNGETLSPDVPIRSAAYALNATYLSGLHDSQFLRSDENDTASGKIFFAGDPSGSGISQGTVFINPSAADPNDTLLGVGVSSSQRFKVDAEGEVAASGTVTVATGSGYGVDASGPLAGGYFHTGAGDGLAWLGRGNTGVFGHGSSTGGEFSDSDSSGYGYVGFGDRGFHGGGSQGGGFFFDTNESGSAWVGRGNRGVEGYGTSAGAYFEDSDSGAYGYVGWGLTGVAGYGTNQGGYFQDLDGSGWARVGYSTYKINGSGSVSFVQNHPHATDRVIVYAAPEGDEVATYTRGTARLLDGEARVRLGETFAWVTNPDVGLTAHVTARGEWADLYVASLSTTEMVVRSAGDARVATFDYQVWGLRIGFEQTSIVQEKERDAPIPSMADHLELYARHPELRRFSPLERFRGMDAASPAPGPHARVAMPWPEPDDAHRQPAPEDAPAPELDVEGRPPRLLSDTGTEDHRVGEPVEPGDVVVLDETTSGVLRRGRQSFDPTVVGIVAGPSPLEGHARIALSGTALCKVDADHGSVRPGDLLTTSSTPGHAMRADVAAPPGTVIGKALEPLASGQGLVRVLVMVR